MNESTSESKTDSKVYEISYILVPSLPQEKVGEETAALLVILEKNSAVVMADEAPSLISLAYEMDKSTGGGVHERFTQGYFGWVKFFCSPAAIEIVRKSFEQSPHILRALAISTVREKTYLGKRAKSDNKLEEKQVKSLDGVVANHVADPAPVATTSSVHLTPAEIVEVDKSIDEIAKGV